MFFEVHVGRRLRIGSGAPLFVYISTSAQKWFAPSGEVLVKKVPDGNAFKVTLKPIASQFFFMIVCVDWRTELFVVWYVISKRTLPLARTPSAPLTYPALSSSAFA